MQRVKTVAVLKGGPPNEYGRSIFTGDTVVDSLSDHYNVVDITVDNEGVWYKNGKKILPAKALFDVDVVFNAMHGEYGEDGKMQQILEQLNIPFTGSKALTSVLAMNKAKAKDIFKAHNIQTPKYFVVHKGMDLQKVSTFIVRNLNLPVVLKPVSNGSSRGVMVTSSHEAIIDSLKMSFEDNRINADKIIVEEFIEGKEAVVNLIENYRGDQIYSLFPVEIKKPKDQDIFSEELKKEACNYGVCPSESFSKEEKEELLNMASLAHQVLNARHYSQTDFIIHPRRGVFVLEINTLPMLHKESLFQTSLEASGISFNDFILHIVALATSKK